MSPLTGLGLVEARGFYMDSAPHGAAIRGRCLAANNGFKEPAFRGELAQAKENGFDAALMRSEASL